MTNSEQRYRPADLSARIAVAAGGAVLLLVVAMIAFSASASWIPGAIVLLLVPVHAVLAVTDTSLLDDPKTAGERAIAELRRLAGGGVVGAGYSPSGPESAGSPTQGSTPWGPMPGAPQAPAAQSPSAPWERPSPTPPAAAPTPPGQAFTPGVPGGAGTAGAHDAHGYGPVPMGPGRSFDPPRPGQPSVVHGFGSYGARHNTAPPDPPAAAPEAPPEPEGTPSFEASAGVDDVDDFYGDDDPDATIQRPPRPRG